jgi:DNA-binding protein H-NS
MDNFLKLATNRNSLKSLTKKFYIDELEKFSLNLNIIIKQRKEQELKRKEKNKEKIQKIENIKLLLAEQGLSINDLTADPLLHQAKKTIKAKTKLLPKYRLVDLDGETHEWTGRGLPPKVFKRHFDRGHTKESCLIIENISL